MSRDSSNKLLQIVNSETPTDVFLYLVSVKFADSTILRYVKNHVNVVSRGHTYVASNFNITLPEEVGDSLPSVNMEFSVNEYDSLARLIMSQKSPELTLEVVLASDPSVVENGPFSFEIRGFSAAGNSVKLEAGFEPFLDLSIPQMKYTPTLFPGLFQHVRGI